MQGYSLGLSSVPMVVVLEGPCATSDTLPESSPERSLSTGDLSLYWTLFLQREDQFDIMNVGRNCYCWCCPKCCSNDMQSRGHGKNRPGQRRRKKGLEVPVSEQVSTPAKCQRSSPPSCSSTKSQEWEQSLNGGHEALEKCDTDFNAVGKKCEINHNGVVSNSQLDMKTNLISVKNGFVVPHLLNQVKNGVSSAGLSQNA